MTTLSFILGFGIAISRGLVFVSNASEAEILTGNLELVAQGLHDVSRQPITLAHRWQLSEMVGVTPEVRQSDSPETFRFQPNEPPCEPVPLGVSDEFSQRRHLGESRRH